MLEQNISQLTTLSNLIRMSLEEDKAFDDVTSDLTIDPAASIAFKISAREDLIFCGADVINEAFLQLQNSAKFFQQKISYKILFKDGDLVKKHSAIVEGFGHAKMIFAAERVILNFIQHLSSIASHVNLFVRNLDNHKIKILDTRKTIPMLRELQKYAVRCGGAYNHRFDLAQMILIKDNHIASCDGVGNALKRVIEARNNLKVEIECDDQSQVIEAIKYSPDVIMLDNMNIDDLQKNIALIRRHPHKILIEVSGGVNLDNIKNFRNLDIDFISIGSLTNSIKIVDIGLDIPKTF